MNKLILLITLIGLSLFFISASPVFAATTCGDLGKNDCGPSDICSGIQVCCDDTNCSKGCETTGTCGSLGQDCRHAGPNFCQSKCPVGTCCQGICDDTTGNCLTNFQDCSDFSNQTSNTCSDQTVQITCNNGAKLSCGGTQSCNGGTTCTPDNSCAANTCSGQSCTDSCGNSYQGTLDCSSCNCDPANYACGNTLPSACGSSCPVGKACTPGTACQGNECVQTGGTGGTGGGCTSSQGIGGGCDVTQGICCSAGSCSNNSGPGTCTNGPVNVACHNYVDPNANPRVPAIGGLTAVTPGIHQDGTPSSIPSWPGGDVQYNWSQATDNPLPGGAGACGGTGRTADIHIGKCDPGTPVWDPAKCSPEIFTIVTPNSKSQANVNNWDGNAWITSSVKSSLLGAGSNMQLTIPIEPNTDNWGGGVANWYPKNWSSDNAGRGVPYQVGQEYWYQINMYCSCDGSQTDGVNTEHMVFVYGGPPPPPPVSSPKVPTLICQASSPKSSNDTHDICNISYPPPLGYGNLSRYDLSGMDNGPAGPRQTTYTHLYTITDITPGSPTTTQIVSGTNNGFDKPFKFDTLNLPTLLQDGHTYSWFVDTIDNALPALPDPDSGPSAPWTFLYDITAPAVSINYPSICYDNTNPPPNIAVSTFDPGTPNKASNVNDVSASIVNETGTTVATQDLTSSCSWSGGATGLGTGNCTINTAGLAQNHNYTVTVTSTDRAGNHSSTQIRFAYRNQCIGPWLQTTSGDVHSNDKVNTPGGPN